MNIRPLKRFQIRKIDAVIVIVLVVIAGFVLMQAGYIAPTIEEVIQPSTGEIEEEEEVIVPEPVTPPESITTGFMRAVSPEDEGLHYDKVSVCREWWYYSAVLSQDSQLAGWTISISFNHMARSDLVGTSKPDMLVATLHGPDGEQYGGLINKERGLGIINQPTLQARTPGVGITYEDSWVEGDAPEWFVHVEDNDIDKDHTIIIDLRFFAPNDPIWTIGDRAFEKSKSNLASYVFLGCNVTGNVLIDGIEYSVQGKGFHEHSWSPNIVTKGLIKGWDWSYIALDNGWEIYYCNYYQSPQVISTKTSEINPFGTLILTTDEADSITVFGDVNPEISETDDEIFTFVEMPLKIFVNGKPGLVQPLLNTYDISLNFDMNYVNAVEQVWKFPTYVGMSIGRNAVSGSITWNDDEGSHEVSLQGIGTMWNMRAFL